MGIEGFNANNSDRQTREGAAEANESFASEGINFSDFLGEGFDDEFFADKLKTFPQGKIFDEWNEFLQSEGGDLSDKTIESDFLTKLAQKLSGHNDAPVMFPVFVQALQSHYQAKGVFFDNVTPERMQRFYDHMATVGE